MASKPNLFNWALEKIVTSILSKEFQVFIVATVLLVMGLITVQIWEVIGLTYMGVRTVQKLKGIDITAK